MDDIKGVAAGKDKFVNLALALYCWMLVGAPFSCHKFRGGPAVDYIGYRCDYLANTLAVNQLKLKWVVRWLVDVEVFRRGLGRFTLLGTTANRPPAC